MPSCIIVLALIAVGLAADVIYLVRRKKAGKCSCGDCSSCGSCAGCKSCSCKSGGDCKSCGCINTK